MSRDFCHSLNFGFKCGGRIVKRTNPPCFLCERCGQVRKYLFNHLIF